MREARNEQEDINSTQSDLRKVRQSEGAFPKFEASIVALIASVSAYVFSFFWLRSYLSYFRIDEVIVQVDLQTVIVAGCTFLGGIGLLWCYLAGLPTTLFKLVINLFFAFRFSLLPAAMFIALFASTGFNWLSIVLGAVALTFLIAECLFLIFTVRQEGGFFAGLDSICKQMLDYNKTTRDGKTSQAIGSSYLNLFLLLGLAPYVLGTVSGNLVASGKGDFLSFTDGEDKYIIVYSQSSYILASEFQQEPGEREVKLTGASKRVSVDQLGQYDLQLLNRVQVSPQEVLRKRITFSEFWNNEVGINLTCPPEVPSL